MTECERLVALLNSNKDKLFCVACTGWNDVPVGKQQYMGSLEDFCIFTVLYLDEKDGNKFKDFATGKFETVDWDQIRFAEKVSKFSENFVVEEFAGTLDVHEVSKAIFLYEYLERFKKEYLAKREVARKAREEYYNKLYSSDDDED